MKEPVEVLNRDTETYRETFGDNEIVIPPNGKIVMNRREAVKFMGTHAGMDPKRGEPKIKNLEIVPMAKAQKAVEAKFICPLDGLEYSSQAELDEHIKLVHPGQQFRDERLEKEAKEKEIPAGSVACPFCSTIVKNKAGLKIHLASCKASEA